MNNTRIPWSEQELKLLEEKYKHYTYKELQEKFFPYRTIQSLRRKCVTKGWVKSQTDILNNSGWTEEDINILKQYYSSIPVGEIRKKYLPQFTETQIISFANGNLKLKRNNRSRWTPKEDEILKKYYEYCTNEEIIKKYLPHRSKSSIIGRARKLGLKTNISLVCGWSEENIDIVKKYFSIMSDDEIHEKYLPQFTPSQIYSCGNKLGLKKNTPKYQHWSDAENQLLKKHFYECTEKELTQKYFPNRTCSGVRSQANKLGLYKDVRSDRGWTKECVNILKERYPLYPTDYIQENFLPQFTKKQIMEFASKCLGIKKSDEYISNWMPESIQIIKDHYSTTTSEELQEMIPEKNPNQINNLANSLGIKKTDEQKKIIKVKSLEKSIICSKPQQKINDLLDSMSIPYEREYFINYYHVDLYLPTVNLMIEVQGDYWHISPLFNRDCVFKDNLAKSKDKSKHSYIKNHYGIETLYLWESDINKDIDKCKALIEEYINSKGVLPNYHSFNYSFIDNKLQLLSSLYEMDY